MPRIAAPWFWKLRGVWCTDIDGGRVVLARGKEARREAEEEFHRLMAARGGKDALGRPRRLTATQLFEMFLEANCVEVERGEKSPATYERYVQHLSAANAAIGTHVAEDLEPRHVHAWIDAPGLAWNATTRANTLTTLKTAYRWARRRRLITKDPTADLAKPTRNRRTLVLGDDQIRTAIEATAGTPFGDLLVALWESGCRPAEVVTLTADKVDLARGIWLVRNKTRRKTGHQFRPIFLTPALLELTRRLIGEHPEGLLFRNARGHAWTRNAQACGWSRLRKQFDWGGEATSYAIRHRYAIDGLGHGLDSSELAALMGHTSAKMIDSTYGHWDKQHDRLREAAARVRPGTKDPIP